MAGLGPGGGYGRNTELAGAPGVCDGPGLQMACVAAPLRALRACHPSRVARERRGVPAIVSDLGRGTIGRGERRARGRALGLFLQLGHLLDATEVDAPLLPVQRGTADE